MVDYIFSVGTSAILRILSNIYVVEVFVKISDFEHTHVEVWFQESCFATLLKLHFDMGVLIRHPFLQKTFIRVVWWGHKYASGNLIFF